MTMFSDSIALQIDKIIANKKSETEAWQTFRRSVMANGNATHDAKLALNNAVFSAYDAERKASEAIEQIVKRTVEAAQPHPNAYPSRRSSPPHGGSSSGSSQQAGIAPAGNPNPAAGKVVPLANPNHRRHVHARYTKIGPNHYKPFPRGSYIYVRGEYVTVSDHRKNANEPFNIMQPDGSVKTFNPILEYDA